MPLHFEPNEEDFKNANYHGSRRAFCDGCGMGVSYEPHRYVFPPEQVDAWIAEHKDHESIASRTTAAAEGKPRGRRRQNP